MATGAAGPSGEVPASSSRSAPSASRISREACTGEMPTAAAACGLAEVAEEAQGDEAARARMQPPHRAGEREPVVGGGREIRARLVGLRVGGDPHALALGAEPAGEADHRAAVAQVVADLAGDRRGRVGLEAHAAARVVAVDRLDQADRAHLDEVLQRLAGAVEAAGDRAHQREVALDQRRAVRVACGEGLHGRHYQQRPWPNGVN